MKQIILLSTDTYKISNNSIITEYDKKIIIDLYQPIIGVLATGLFFTILNDYNSNKNNMFYHNHLMVNLKAGINEISNAFKSLEAVGLIKTFIKKNDNQNDYIYEIYSPLSPNNFFNHPVLNTLLNNNVGNKEYNNLISLYKSDFLDKTEYQEISSKMNDIYIVSTSEKDININYSDINYSNINIGEVLDFDLIISNIPKNIISDKAFSKKICELLNSLAFIYNINTIEMIELIKISISDNGMINKESLVKNVRNYYEFNNNGSKTNIIYKNQPDSLKKKTNDLSNKSKMIYVFENTSPYDFLTAKNKGVKPTGRDLKILEYLAVELKLMPAVINVLIDYVLRINDNKLNKAYIETIASQWIRSNIKTAEEAMKIAEKEHKNSKKKVSSKREEKVPVWFNEDNKDEIISDTEKQELEDLLKDFR